MVIHLRQGCRDHNIVSLFLLKQGHMELGVIIFSLVWFLFKKINQNEFLFFLI